MDQAAGSAAPLPQAAVLAVTPTPPARVSCSDRVPALAWLIAAAFVAIELAVSGRYGFMQDELYFIEAGRHLAFGYVDQPPLTPLLTRISEVAGPSPTAIRVIPALAGGAVVVAAARFAALFGAGRLGRVLAALAMACAPVLLAADHVDNTTPLDLLAWTAVLLFVTTALLRHRPRWWLGAGAWVRHWPSRAASGSGGHLSCAGQPPTSIFTGFYAEASALDVLGSAHYLPPVLSGHHAYWMWGPGHASDQTVLVVDALGTLRPHFTSCRLLATYHAPYRVQNDWTGIQIGICTGPVASWHTLWPRLKHCG